MEPNVNPLVPNSSEPPTPPKPATPYSPSEPGAAEPNQFGNSTFQSRTISPLEPIVTEAVPAPQPYAPTPTNVGPPPQAPLPPPPQPLPQMPPQPQNLPTMPTQPVTGAFVGSDNTLPPSNNIFTPQMPMEPAPKRKFRFLSKPVLAGFVVLLLGIGFAAYYFGYKHNPSVIYSQSLSNSAKGYDKLVSYVDEQSKAKSSGTVGTGSFKLKSEGFSTDGKIAFKSDNKNSELSFDVGLVGARLSFDSRLIDSSAGSPDVYIKASGIKGLGTMAGFADLDASLAKLDSSWIVIDHTLFDSFADQKSAANSIKPPTESQILDAAEAFGKVNQQYLFSTKQDKAVFSVTKKVGFEEVDGHSTYHYEVAVQKNNLKAYIDAQKSALLASKLSPWLKANGYDKIAESALDDTKNSVNAIKSNEKIDMWADVDQRIIYKVRFVDAKNPATSFVDVGLDYKGGNDFPFFIATQTKDGSDKSNFKAVINLNTETKETEFKVDASTTGSSAVTFSLKMNFKSSGQAVKVEKPANAKPLAQVLSELGYGDLLGQLGTFSSGSQDTAKDSKRKSDILSLTTQMEAYFSENGYYPSLANINSSSWRKTNFKSLDENSLQDPDGTSKTLVKAPAANVYAYKVTTTSGASCENDSKNCAKYTLTATLSDGTPYSRDSLE